MKGYRSRLKDLYEKEVVGKLEKQFGYKNRMEIPKIQKVIVSMGLKDAVFDSKVIDKAFEELYLITGQKPVVTKAKKSIATYKLREGMPIGCKVTLRGDIMFDFIDRLVNIALPREKDFKGLDGKKFDGKGNYSVGFKEQIIFPEINYDKIDKIRGLNIAIVTTAKSNDEAKALLTHFNFPFYN